MPLPIYRLDIQHTSIHVGVHVFTLSVLMSMQIRLDGLPVRFGDEEKFSDCDVSFDMHMCNVSPY